MILRLIRRRFYRSRVWAFLAVAGPGLVAANADNDASGILGYSLAGARYEYRLLWALAVCVIALAVCQEMGARMGTVTGKGLADLIREEFGVRITLVAMLALLVANACTTVANFAGILAAVRIFAGPDIRFVVLPGVAAVVWLLVSKGTYRGVERVLLAAASVYLLYVVSAWLAHPPWATVLRETVAPSLRGLPNVHDYVFVLINLIGTTITPWGQFYIQSSVRDKGIKAEEYGYTRIEVYGGALFTIAIAYFIVVCCGSTLYAAGVHEIEDAGKAALALKPLAGTLATVLFAIGLFNSGCFGVVAVPLSTAYALTESLGWESGLGRRIREAPLFIGVYSLLVIGGAATVMLFPNHLTMLMIMANIVGGMLLPIILVLMLRLVNNKRLMGDYTNGPIMNWVAVGTTALLIALSLALVVGFFWTG
ncbi:MAG: divalent metal cation transporter [Chthonomonadales bacterium]|nr:divalent metal cation transporter [Chthonomonadales bacterium]